VDTGISTSAAGDRWWHSLIPGKTGVDTRLPSGEPGAADIWAGLTPALGLRVAGLILAASSVFLAALIGSSVSTEQTDEIVIAVAFGLGLGFGIALVVVSLRSAPAWLMHAVPIAFFSLLFLTISNLGDAEPRLVMGYATVLVWVALFMSPRSLALYASIALGIFIATFARHTDDPLAGLSILIATILLVTICVVTAMAREHLDRVTRQAAELSGRDPLTGLANLRPLHEKMEMLIRKTEREKTELALLIVELDDFKLVNDRYSRTTGDRTLQAVAEALAGVVRANELVARRGGAEFAFVTETSDPREIEALIERISGEIAVARLAVCPDGPTGITVGVATCRSGDTVARLMSRADKALREARTGLDGGRVIDDGTL
jgi:diguanylate cyclase (GGDEF)-like protein